MKIVITSVTDTGIYRNMKELVTKLIDRGHNVYIVSPDRGALGSLKLLGCNTIELLDFYPRGKNPLQDFKLYKNYLKIYNKIKPDIVLSLTIKPAVYSGLACRRLKIKYFTTISGAGDALSNPGLLKKITIFLLKIGLKKANNVFFQNEDNKKLFIDEKIIKPNKGIVVAGSGINLNLNPLEPYPTNEKTNFLYIGRVTRDKGVLELFEAIQILKRDGYDLVFNVIGKCDDSLKSVLEQMIDKGLINYYGVVEYEQIHKIIKKNDAIILPSYHEGIANVLLEASAAGRPVLSTNVEGCKETFINGQTGFMFEPRSCDEIIKTVKKFLNLSLKERENMGLEARKYIENKFDRNLVDGEYIRVLEEKIWVFIKKF